MKKNKYNRAAFDLVEAMPQSHSWKFESPSEFPFLAQKDFKLLSKKSSILPCTSERERNKKSILMKKALE